MSLGIALNSWTSTTNGKDIFLKRKFETTTDKVQIQTKINDGFGFLNGINEQLAISKFIKLQIGKDHHVLGIS